MMLNIEELVRKNIRELKPYSSARSEFKGTAKVFLDANENAFGSPLEKDYNRYPDPLQMELKQALARLKKVDTSNIGIGNGSDEIIDHIIRIFCRPGIDNIITSPPTFRMYGVAAAINDTAVKEVLLTEDFQLDISGIFNAIDQDTKLIFLCSPNNPTGNLLHKNDIEILLEQFRGIIVIDEAYFDFCSRESFIEMLSEHNNLIVLQTLSKAWGLAGLRIGAAFAAPEIIRYLSSVKTPYNVSSLTQQLAIEALRNRSGMENWTRQLVEQRGRLAKAMEDFPFIKKIYPSDANFLLVKVTNAQKLYEYLLAQKIVVRNQSSQPLLNNCLRITIGTPAENESLIKSLKNYSE